MKMKKKLLLLLLLFAVIFFPLFSAPVDIQTARTIARNFMDWCRPSAGNSIKSVAVRQQENTATMYCISFEGGGWVLIAGDDVIEPVWG
jgi:hypothetical protein